MGYSPILNDQVVKTLDSSEIAHMGGFTLPKDGELNHIRLTIYKQGTAGGTEQLRIGVYSRSDLAAQLFTSDWAELSDWTSAIGSANGDNQIGLMRFDFDRQHLDSDTEYHLAIETNNYTRNANTFYLSFAADWPLNINTPSTNQAYYAAYAGIYCYFDREKPD